ncbi:putative AdoMet-dependent methyltransferase [Paenibacillus sp. 1_12]|uniref:MerR family transcriptional regulator n=1 Tax=Paenibacillus sp. 1_12 TaxID=1566278 RepID=UPI0008F1FA85|nr:MerR family transcriptional regulator [Paenibacillus sp. 1_12]SFL69237.1 putative AdoMet-dependent methyltransferase [Paenibacillus sp. 1_12]
MKINELARRLDVTPRAIRFYEEKGLLQPLKNEHNGYRHYTEEDAWRLQTITSFREMGIGIESIAKLLRVFDSGDATSLHHHLELQRAILFSQWVEWKQTLVALDTLINQVDEGKPLILDDLFKLAEHTKRIRTARSSWEDQWDFDQIAEQFDRKRSDLSESPVGWIASASEYEQALAFTVQWLAPRQGEVGLDIGAGTGNLSGRLLESGAEVAAVEQSRQMLVRCRGKYPALQAKLGNLLALPYFDGQFHFAATSFAFHHVNEAQQLLGLAEIDRVLKPHGRVVITGLMFEHEAAKTALLNRLRAEGRIEVLDKLAHCYPSDRTKLLEWFHERGYITVQQQLNEWVHMVYALRQP